MNIDTPFGTRPRITNIVASGRLPKPIDIEKAYSKINFPVKEYEPENYPALLVKIKVNDNLRHVTLYKNGKYIIAGATSEKELHIIYDELVKILTQNKIL